MKTATISLTLILLSAVFWTSEVSSVCCKQPCTNCYTFAHYCDDCTKTNIYCGVGKCNIFGCDCDGGCRKGIGCYNCDCPIRYGAFDHSHPPVQQVSDAEYLARSDEHLEQVLSQADQSGDGKISREEFEQWIEEHHPTPKSERTFDVRDEFKELDLDRSGFLTREEIDPPK